LLIEIFIFGVHPLEIIVFARISPHCSKYAYGFGFDSSNNDYNIVVVAYLPSTSIHEIEVFSLKTNSWKMIQQHSYDYEIEVFSLKTNSWKMIRNLVYVIYELNCELNIRLYYLKLNSDSNSKTVPLKPNPNEREDPSIPAIL
jgi:hypothetical protein